MSPDVVPWTPERREVLDRALRKVQAAKEQHEQVAMTGAEGAALAQAAESWRDLMRHLDGRALAGDLDGIINR